MDGLNRGWKGGAGSFGGPGAFLEGTRSLMLFFLISDCNLFEYMSSYSLGSS